jgi:hypothetical protein
MMAARRKRRAAIGTPYKYYERDCCDDCMTIHWVEKPRHRKVICHGRDYLPHDTGAHYAKHLGRGVEIRPITRLVIEVPLPLEWQMAEALADVRDDAPAYVQDW